MNPLFILAERWAKAAPRAPELTMTTIQFTDRLDEAMDIIGNLGAEIDIIPTTLDVPIFYQICSVWKLADIPLRIGVPVLHPLSGREKLQISDLAGQSFLLSQPGINECSDQVFDDLLAGLPGVRVQYVNSYDHELFNKAFRTNRLIVGTDCWKQAHPMIEIKPVEWDYTMPFGILFLRKPSDAVMRFIHLIS